MDIGASTATLLEHQRGKVEGDDTRASSSPAFPAIAFLAHTEHHP